MQIAGLQKTTLVDFPGTIAATVFTRGCTFRCPFCHNPELVLPEKFIPLIPEEEIWAFFEKRKNQLKGVCITGGEPTMQPDLPEFISRLKSMGYKIKLDTNGTNPKMLKNLIKSGNLDYIAMDIKAPLSKYSKVAISNSKLLISNQIPKSQMINEEINDKDKWKKKNDKLIVDIKQSIGLIMESDVDYEFRTTVAHPIHEVEDFKGIGELISGANKYFIQNFVQSKHVNEHTNFKPFTNDEINQAKKIMDNFVQQVSIR